MTRRQMFFKRLLDISMLISFILLAVFMLLAVFSVMQGAIQFNDSSEPVVLEEFAYLRGLYIATIIGIILSVIMARVFLSFVVQEDKLESASDYRNRVSTKKSQTQMLLRQNEMVYEEPRYVPKKDRNRILPTETPGKEISVSEILHHEQQSKQETTPVVEEVKPEVIVEPIQEEVIVEPVQEEVIVEPVQEEVIEQVVSINDETPKTKKQYYTRLNKKELNTIISKVLDTSLYKSRKFVNGLLAVIQDELVLGNEVKIDDFGRFYLHTVKEHVGVNPSTGEKITIPEHRVVKFKPYKKFKDDITNDVVETSERYLLKETDKREMDEITLSNELQKEKVAEEHVEDTVTKPMYKKASKPSVPKKTKKDVIEYIAASTDVSKNKANKFFKGLLEVVSEEMSKKQDVDIKGFGKFTTIHIPAKEAVNPQTNEKIIVQEHDQIKLRFSKEFKAKFK